MSLYPSSRVAHRGGTIRAAASITTGQGRFLARCNAQTATQAQGARGRSGKFTSSARLGHTHEHTHPAAGTRALAEESPSGGGRTVGHRRWRTGRAEQAGSRGGTGLRSVLGAAGNPPRGDGEASGNEELCRRSTRVEGFGRGSHTGRSHGEGCSRQQQERQPHQPGEVHGDQSLRREACTVGGRASESGHGHGH